MDGENAIAIVAVGCKFPGADDLEEFWNVLLRAENHVIEIPKERWNLDAFYDKDPNKSGKTYARKAGLLKSHDEFDNKLFNISGIEGERMDPQQRYVLECVHMALEDGGMTRKMIDGSNTGVFIGCMNDDYKVSTSDELSALTNYSLTGGSTSIIAARVSYVYNLLGPSMIIDTACSSSITAIDIAIQNIKSGRCSMAICGGVNSILTPDMFIPLSRAQMLSPTGQCHAFSRKADGYVRGEGCGIVILKQLADAENDGNKIWATIATDCNQDGHTATPITAPSAKQQLHLLQRIYAANKVNISDIQVIEAHGTGTLVGDPIEVNSLKRFFGRNNDPTVNKDHIVYIGSVKTNIGHLEAAAGVAGLIKVLLMIRHKTIVPSLNFSGPHENIDFDGNSFIVPDSVIKWNYDECSSRMACTNSFGFGGTNAHMIIKEYCEKKVANPVKDLFESRLIFLSTCDQNSITDLFSVFLKNLKDKRYSLNDISFTSLCCRDHFSYRVAILTNSVDDLQTQCKNKQKELLGSSMRQVPGADMVLVFCGVGSTWTGMCSQLLLQDPVVQTTFKTIDTILQKWVNLSVFDLLSRSKDLSDPFLNHLAIFTCQVALWDLWQHWGLHVDVVLGLSVGEVAAAYAAGCLTLEQAVTVIYHRSNLLKKASRGTMFVVRNCETEYVNSVCDSYNGRACIAVYFSTLGCTVSCDTEIAEELKSKLRKRFGEEEKMNSVFISDLPVNCAYHSQYTVNPGIELEEVLSGFQGSPPKLKIISTVYGKEACETDFVCASYWRMNVVNPVSLQNAIEQTRKIKDFQIYIEIGPKPFLPVHLSNLLDDSKYICLPSMKEKSEMPTLLSTVGKLFEHGINLNWNKLFRGTGKLCAIPRYCFCRNTKLFLSDTTLLKQQGLHIEKSKHLFMEQSPNGPDTFKINISEAVTPFVFDHNVSKTAVIPGAFYVEVALYVGQSLFQCRPQDIAVKIEFVRLFQLLVGRKHHIASVQISNYGSNQLTGTIKNNSDTFAQFSLNQVWNTTTLDEAIDLKLIQARCNEFQSSDETYEILSALGFTYGHDLKILGDVWKNDYQCFVQMHVSDIIWKDIQSTNLHPSILDGMLQTPVVFQNKPLEQPSLIPTGIGRFILRRPPERKMICYTEIAHTTDKYVFYNMLLLTQNGGIIAEVKNFKIRHMNTKDAQTSVEYEMTWKEIYHLPKLNPEQSNKKAKNLLLLSFNGDVLSILEKHLSKYDVKTRIIEKGSSLADVKGYLTSVFMSYKNMKTVCFVPGLIVKDDMSGGDIMGIVLSSCTVVLAIVQVLINLKQKPSVIIITERTQVHEMQKCKNVNICGSELWGQVRSILQEVDNLDILLLDCQPSITEASCVIERLLFDETVPARKFREMLLFNGKLYTNHLQHYAEDNQIPNFRTAPMDECYNVEIRSRDYSNDVDTFCVLQTDNVMMKENCVLLAVTKAWLHSSSLYPTTFRLNHSRSTIFHTNDDTGFSILSFEVIGLIQNDPSLDNKQRPSHMMENEVLTCFPTKVQRLISVPSSCIYKLQDLPQYKPGMQVATVCMLAIADTVKVGDLVNIICDRNNIFPSSILQFILQSTGKCQSEIFNNNCNILHVTKLVLLKQLCTLEIETLIKSKNIEEIIALSNFVNQDSRVYLEMNNVQVTSLQIENILSQHNLTMINPMAFEWLRKYLLETNNEQHIQDKCFELNSIFSMKPLSLASENILRYNTIEIPTKVLFRKDSVYIIVGGHTGLGRELVKLMASREAGNIIILSRREMDDENKNEFKEISLRYRCQIWGFSVDITNFQSLEKTFLEIEETCVGKIRGFFHGAAVLDDLLCTSMEECNLRNVLGPKVMGTWNLHRISERYKLDYFVMHSSITSIIGNAGQSNYAAGNSFMDSFAYYRRACDLCGQTINWGPLDLGLMNYKPHIGQTLQDTGLILFSLSEIKDCFIKNLQCNPCQIIYGNVDWSLYTKNIPAYARPRFAELSSNDGEISDRLGEFGKLDELAKIINAPTEKLIEKIHELVLRTAAETFSIDVGILRTNTCIRDLGIDSMQYMTFSNKLNDLSGIRISIVTLLSEDTSFKTVAAFIKKEIEENHYDFQLKQAVEKNVFQSLTPVEKKAYDNYLDNPNDPSLFIFADLEVSGRFADRDKWILTFTHLHAKHSALRTLFLPDKEKRYQVRKETLSPMDVTIDFNEVPIKELLHESKVPDNVHKYAFDPAKDLPLRVMIGSEGEKCIIRFVFSDLVFDFTSVKLAVDDIVSLYKSVDIAPQEDLDIAVIYEKKLKQQKLRITDFWKENMPSALHVMSFKDTKTTLDPQAFNCIVVTVDERTISDLKCLLDKNHLKLFEVLATLYQFILALEIPLDSVAIFAMVDMRIHFAELQDRICRLTNSIPLFFKVDNMSQNVIDFIKEYKTFVSGAIENSLLPFNEIIDLLNACNPSDVFRHQIIMETVKGNESIHNFEEFGVRLKRICTGSYSNESALYIWNNLEQNYLKFEFGYSTLMIDDDRAKHISDSLLRFLKTIVSDDSATFNYLASEHRKRGIQKESRDTMI